VSARRRRRTRIDVSVDRGVFMISVAAELADMHPQTLRMYEARGLIEPKRSPKGTRLYSYADVEKLKRIQQMTAELGLNLAGVERVLQLEGHLERAKRKIELLERQLAEARRQADAAHLEAEHLKQQLSRARGELLPYRRWDLVPVRPPEPPQRSGDEPAAPGRRAGERAPEGAGA
jgi:MerR family transcriptional regulator/heat shock protein HspR